MNACNIRDAVLAALISVAPEIDPTEVRDETDLREEYDLDSFDYMNFLTGIQTRCGVLISEADAGKMRTVGECVKFVEERGDGGGRDRICPASTDTDTGKR